MTDLFYKLACRKFDNPNKEVDWSVIAWQDWKRILPDYLISDIEMLMKAQRFTEPYAFDCCVGRVYGNIALAVRDKKIIWEQAAALRRLYIYDFIDKGIKNAA